ncbi:MAG: hypothetical protein ACRDPW_09730 [Mycobacteriales bacterium]
MTGAPAVPAWQNVGMTPALHQEFRPTSLQPAQSQPTEFWPMEWDEAAVAALPEDGYRYEIYEGALLVSPPARWDHQEAESALLFSLHHAAPAG